MYSCRRGFCRLRQGMVRTSIILIVVLAIFGTPVRAQQSEAARYRDCMDMIDRNAEAAFDEAIAWRDLGGAAPARHCAAAALLQLGYNNEAATRLEALAQDPALDLSLKPTILRQAAEAWLNAGNTERAYAALTSAIKLQDSDPALWTDRGIVLAEMGLLDEAIDDLSRAIILEPNDATAWLLRGSAYRMLDNLAAAESDIAEALRLDPSDLTAYLERGNLRRLQGDDEGARKDWMIVIRNDPESDLAQTARLNIERMDVDAKGE